MEARYLHSATVLLCLLSLGASHRTKNFLVTAPTPALSLEVAEAAERFRHDLAVEWLGKALPDWREPCPIAVHVGPHKGAGGATSFMFDRGRPFGWTMTIQGSRERILDSVLPHEITHTVFASHFGRPLPRWADEGACTTVEHRSEKLKQEKMLLEFLRSKPTRGIAFNQLFAMKEYPHDVMPLYAQGFSLAKFLIAQGGKRQFVEYVGDGMKWNNWPKATREHYGFQDLSELQLSWLEWVRRGYPPISPKTDVVAAAPAVSLTSSSPAAAEPSVEVDRLREPASGGSRTGWYARTRDRAGAAIQSLDRSIPVRSASHSRSPAASRQQVVTRPQRPVQPTQRVIEWRHPQAGTPRLVAPPTSAYLTAPYNRRGTIMR